jgi:hypothetical protein
LWVLGAPLGWITVCLLRENYHFRKEPGFVTKPGEFSWSITDPTDIRLVWQPRLAYYPCSLVGIGKLNDPKETSAKGGDLFLLAWGHNYDPDHPLSIFDCAEVLRNLGAQAVLMIDEGQDVFQQYFKDATDLRKKILDPDFTSEGWEQVDKQHFVRVPFKRDRIRASLSFWVEADSTPQATTAGESSVE